MNFKSAALETAKCVSSFGAALALSASGYGAAMYFTPCAVSAGIGFVQATVPGELTDMAVRYLDQLVPTETDPLICVKRRVALLDFRIAEAQP